MKEKFKAYYHKFINYLKSNWVKVLCIFIVVVYFVCGLVSFYKNGSSSDVPLKNDTSIPITSTYKVINKKQAIQSDETSVTIGENEFSHSMLEFPSGECSLVRSFDNTSFSVRSSVGGVYKFQIDFKPFQKKFITFNWHNPDQVLIKFYYNDVVISELDEFIVDYSYNFYFSSNGNETSSLICSVTPSYVDRDSSSPTISFWNIGIYDMTSYYDYASNQGFTNGYNDGVSDGFADGHDQGYTEGKNEGLTEGERNGYSKGFNDGKLDGLSQGRHEGYQNGYTEGKNDGLTEGEQKGHQIGYDEGYSVGSSVVQVKDVFIDILEAPFNILKNAFNFEILGINFSSILVGVVSILLVAFVIRKVI